MTQNLPQLQRNASHVHYVFVCASTYHTPALHLNELFKLDAAVLSIHCSLRATYIAPSENEYRDTVGQLESEKCLSSQNIRHSRPHNRIQCCYIVCIQCQSWLVYKRGMIGNSIEGENFGRFLSAILKLTANAFLFKPF